MNVKNNIDKDEIDKDEEFNNIIRTLGVIYIMIMIVFLFLPFSL